MTEQQYPLLSNINTPEDLRLLNEKQLPNVAQEIRDYLINTLDICGGHFGANLCTIELTIALHYALNTPDDRLIWDVGHQAYPHKILTGRKNQLHTIKQKDGLAPFPCRNESPYDTFGTGHSSTSIGAALGSSVGSQLKNEQRRTIAIIGDGGLTGGMAFEALNHAGDLDHNITIVLNDNNMSISNNVGALAHYLGRILSGKTYVTLREGSKKILANMPPLSRLAKLTETHLKGMIQPGSLFEEMGINYFGPIDGHDTSAIIRMLNNTNNIQGPKIIHAITKKGKGYPLAEEMPIKYHAVKPGFHTQAKSPTETSQKTAKRIKPTSYSEVFGQWLCDTAASDKRLVGITPAMSEGSGMTPFSKQYPNQFFDVGIAEQHAATFAAGLAVEGVKPVLAIYSTFLQRAYDQVIHDIAIQNLDVTFAIDRAGLVGNDGATHMGAYDISFLRCIPNMVIMAPSSLIECRTMLQTAYEYPGPAAVRYPKEACTLSQDTHNEPTIETIPIGKACYCKKGNNIALLAFGNTLSAALIAAETLGATVINMRFVKPIDHETINEVAKQHQLIVSIEEHSIMGGAGSAVAEALHQQNHNTHLLTLGIPDDYIHHASSKQQRQQCNLTPEGIIQAVETKQKAISSQTVA